MNIPSLSCSSFFSFIDQLNTQKNKPIVAIISLIAISILALYGLHRITTSIQRKFWPDSPNSLSVINLIQKLKHSLFSIDRIQWNGETALTQAAVQGDLAGVRKLVLKGASINQVNKYGNAPLHLAAFNGDLGVVEFLLENGADPEIRNKMGRTPLHIAAFEGHLEVVNKLLAHGVDCNLVDNEGYNSLHDAACGGHKEIAECLIKADIDLEAMSPDTPAHQAYKNHYKQLGDWLIKQEKNQTSQCWIQLRSFVHKFGMDHLLNYKDQKVELHGFDTINTHDELVRSLKQTNQWIKKGPPGWAPNDTECIYKTLEKGIEILDLNLNLATKLAETINAHQNGEVIVIPVSYLIPKQPPKKSSTHAVSIVIYKNLLIKCDRRGGDDDPQPGLSVYKINHPAKLEEAVEKLIKVNRQENGEFFKKGMDQMLDLELIHHLKHSEQKSGTCAWTSSAKLSFHSLLYLYLIQQGFTEKEAEEYSQSMYKTWMQEDRHLAIQDLLSSQASETIKKNLLAAAFFHLSLKKVLKKNQDKEDAATDILLTLMAQQKPEVLDMAEKLVQEKIRKLDEIKRKLQEKKIGPQEEIIL